MHAVLKSILLAAIANGVSLAVAALIFGGFEVSPAWYVIAVVVFTALAVSLRHIVASAAGRFWRASTIVGGLVLTFAALWLTHVIVPGEHFHIEGWWTWLGVTALVWAAGIAYGEVDSSAPENTPGTSA